MNDIKFMKLANRAHEILDQIRSQLLDARKDHEKTAETKKVA